MTIAYLAGLHVGSVEACSPLEIKVLLDGDAPQDVALNTGRLQAFPRLNGYVLVPNEGGTVVCLIARMNIEPAPRMDRGEAPAFAASRRRLFAAPIGTLLVGSRQSAFELRRGVASYPAVGDAVLLPTADQLQAIVESSGENRRVKIGTARLALDAEVTVDPDKIFGRHIGIFGNTGSGKSCTVAGLIRWSVEAAAAEEGSPRTRFIVLDPNGEYRTCFKDLRKHVDVQVFSVEPGQDEAQLTVPAWMWNGEEWAGALEAAPGTQRPILMQAIRNLRASAVEEMGATGGPQSAEGEMVVLAVKMRAWARYLEGLRAQGVEHLSDFKVFQPLHSNLEGLEEMLQGAMGEMAEAGDAAAAVQAVLAASGSVRARRTTERGDRVYLNHIRDGDLAEVVGVIEALIELLPTPEMIAGPTEDFAVPV